MSTPKQPRTDASPDALTVVPGRVVTYHNEPALPKISKGLPEVIAASRITAQKRYKHQRTIRVSVALPASVELVVGTNDDDPSEDSDWMIVSARDARCEVSPLIVEENMHDSDFEAMTAQAASAEDDE